MKIRLSLATAFCLCLATGGVAAEPLKVFILAGQSNMQGHAHVRTFDAMALNEDAAPILEKIADADGAPRVVDDVWISSLGSAKDIKTGQLTVGYGADGRGPKIGPEFAFGIYMHEALNEPILLIKTAWGGKSLHTDFRPPSAGPYQFNESQLENFRKRGVDPAQAAAEKAEATGRYYRLMIAHIEAVLSDVGEVVPGYDENQGYELAGFVWFQGWNDMVDGGTYPNRGRAGGYDQYSELMTTFIRDVRNDLKTPDLPFVIGVMGVGGPTAEYGPDQQRYLATHQNFRDAMAAPAELEEFEGTVAAVLTENYWDMNVVELRRREKPIQKRRKELNAAVKAGETTRKEADEEIENLYQAEFSTEELTVLRDGVSNFDFHYMGSAGVMAQIGKGFAEAMTELIEEEAE